MADSPLSPVAKSRPLEPRPPAGTDGLPLMLLMRYAQTPGHCTFTTAEIGAALATLTERIDTRPVARSEPRGDEPARRPTRRRRYAFCPLRSRTRFFAYSQYPAEPS